MRLHFGDDVDEDELGAPVNVRGGGGGRHDGNTPNELGGANV
jgi:hypothetical protein